jgi:predicted thioesterase
MHIGAVAEVRFTVTPEMRAGFEGRVVHDALATASMIVWMEWAGRQIILPYLEPHEEGVGYEVHIRHLAPAPVGAAVTCRATLTAVRGREIRTAVEAIGPSGPVGEGEFTQMIVDRERFRRRLEAAARAVAPHAQP